ncbi:MAG TPA: alpha/beta hydrolase [Candidatus Dormibacteraeota bacterium]
MPAEFVHLKEPGTGTPLLLLHGTGADETQLLGLGRMLAPGAPLLSPRGKVLENGMPRYFRRLAEGVFDQEDLRARALELAVWVDANADDPPLAVGFSNGANIASAMLLLSPHTLSGALLIRPMVPFEPDPLPDLRGKRVLLLSGRADPMVAPGQPERLAALLRRAGADVELSWQSAGHELGAGDVAEARGWMRGGAQK